jgi:mRNA-degrading endonuclease RelE of RelBE toxin-antitoxin system
VFTVEVKRRALQKLEELDEKRRDRIKEIILPLKDDPIPFRKLDLSKLKGYDNLHRIPVGDQA